MVLKSGYVGCAIGRLDNEDVISSDASVGSPVDKCRVRVVLDLASRYVVGDLALVDGLILLSINGDGLLVLGFVFSSVFLRFRRYAGFGLWVAVSKSWTGVDLFLFVRNLERLVM